MNPHPCARSFQAEFAGVPNVPSCGGTVALPLGFVDAPAVQGGGADDHE